MRIVSLCPSNTEMLAYLGLTDHIVGVDNYSDWPEAINQVERVGPDLSINMDKVQLLEPDLVIASLSVPGMEKNIEALNKTNLNYVTLNPQSLNDIADDFITLGKATNTLDFARQVVTRYFEIIDRYRQISRTVIQTPSLYWEWWPKPIFTPGKTNWLTEISTLAGANNIFSSINTASYQTDWQEIREKDPNIINMVWVGVKPEKVKKSFLLKRDGSNELNAVKNNRVFVLEEPLYCRPSPRLLLGLKKLASLVHPDIFPSFDGTDDLLSADTKTTRP